MSGYARRKAVNLIMMVLCGLAAAAALLPLGSVLWLVVSRGIAGLSFTFFTALPTPVGESGGGVGNAVVGTLQIVASRA